MYSFVGMIKLDVRFVVGSVLWKDGKKQAKQFCSTDYFLQSKVHFSSGTILKDYYKKPASFASDYEGTHAWTDILLKLQ